MRTLLRATLLFCSLLLATAAQASGSVSLSVQAVFPSSPTVGQTGIPVVLQIVNTSTNPHNTGSVVLNEIYLHPSCGAVGGMVCGIPDPGVYGFGATATGRSNTACAGTTFTVGVGDPSTGRLDLVPQSPVTLGHPGSATHACVIDLVADVVKMPQSDVTPVTPGVQTYANSYASATHVPSSTPGSGSGSTAVTVARGTPAPVVSAVATAGIGQPISDAATIPRLGVAAHPTGSVIFQVYGPDNATCSGPPVFQSTVPLAGQPPAAASGSFTPTAMGVWRWVALYSGDANYDPVQTVCSDASQQSTVTKAAPAIGGTASADVTLGGVLSDTATLAGGYGTPGGTIRFDLYGPDNAGCTGTPIHSETVALSGGSASSAPFTPSKTGTYRWVATYSGDANNAPVATACDAPAQVRTVRKIVPALTQTPTGTVRVGGVVSDLARLAVGANPTGTITFRLFGPDDATCSRAPATTIVRTVTGNGDYGSGDFVTAAAGNYRWTVAYSGDASHEAVATICGQANVAVTTGAAAVPLGLSAKAAPKRDRRLPYRYRITGRLSLPASVPAASGCLGRLSVQIKNGSKTISTRTVSLKADCSYASRVKFSQRKRLRRRGGKLKVIVKFLGTPAVQKIAAGTITVRYG